jgi:hypothetical protein
MPQTHIIAGQMHKELTGKTITNYEIQNSQQLQHKDFISVPLFVGLFFLGWVVCVVV